MSQLVEFYRGTGEDSEGRKLADLWAFNFRAPTLSDEDIRAFRDEPGLRANLERSFDRFLAFLGLAREGDRVVPAADFEAKREVFLAPDHNWLRITRVLTSLRLLGLEDLSRSLYDGLLDLMKDGRARITAETRRYWRDAAPGGAG